MHSVIQSILLSHDGVSALEKLIVMKKLESPYFSKNYLTRKLGLSSRGYLTDVFKGRKKLSARYVRPIVDLLGLTDAETSYLEKKLLLSTEFVKTDLQKNQLEHELNVLERKFRTRAIPVDDHSDAYALSLVYLSFFLFTDKQASRRELYQSLKIVSAAGIDMALRELLLKGLLIEKDHRISVNPERDISFLNAQYSSNREVQFLKRTVGESFDKVDMVRTHREEVLFQSTVLTVKRKRYLEFLGRIKHEFRTMIADLDDEDPDSMVRFNIQLYPISTARKVNRAKPGDEQSRDQIIL